MTQCTAWRHCCAGGACRIVSGRFLIAGHGRILEHAVIGLVAVGTPDPLETPGIGVHHDDAGVEVAVGDVRLVRLRIDDELGGPAEVLHVLAVGLEHARRSTTAAGGPSAACRGAPLGGPPVTRRAFLFPICIRNLPSLVNFRR